MVITILDGGELTIQTIGAFLARVLAVFFATRTCHWAFVSAIHIWWISPRNRNEYIKDFAAEAAKGNVDMTLMLKYHPETMSETFGDTSTTEHQIVEASVRPAAHLLLLGNVLMHIKGGDIFSCALHALRGAIAPFGLMMVMNTPVISGAGGSNSRLRRGLPISDLDILYVFQWVLLHFVGFFCFLGPTTLIELPVAVLEVFNPPRLAEGEEWHWAAELLWYFLACLRVVCPILMLRACPILFAPAQAKNPNTFTMKKWYAEFCVGELGSAVMYFNAVSVFVLPGRSYGVMDAVLILVMLAESLRILCVWGIWSLWLLRAWDTIDFHYECMTRSTMSHGPVMTGLRKLTNRQLVFLHAVQAGHYDPTEWCVTSSPVPIWLVNGALGVAQGPVRLFVFRPELYENFHAFDFVDVQVEDLDLFREDMLAVIDALPTASTLFFPFGDQYKKKVRRPFLCLSCEDFDAEVARIAGPKQKANTDVPEASDTEEVAYDITEKVLQMAGCPRQFQMQSFCRALSEEGGAIILRLFGQLVNEQGYEEAERPDLGPHYEVQVRGLRSRSTFVLRTQKSQKLPPGWADLPQVSLLPPELSGPSSSDTKKAQ
ncbi:rsph10b [Symbiodinium natans]|uniref:Rsph10b protein n=1 Tax=Symbiodinium natans TaxID=878477 RepID=A0A812SZ90_9DINO|nr:rsph10b [Symbiodinium natans]